MLLKNVNLNNEITDIKIENGKITAIGKSDCCADDILDLGGLTVYPGLVDIHTHGCIGIDTMDAEKLSEMAIWQAENGITSFLPTTMTMDIPSIRRVTDQNIAETEGADILGFHLEGPYINVKYKGAQNEAYIKNPDAEEFRQFKNAKMVTIAPELDGSMDFIRSCGTVVALGHSCSDYETGVEAFRAGAKCLTHTFNAMPPLHHREPSLIGAAIEEDGYAQVICDGLHIHKSVITALYRIFGSDRMVLISDSMRATGISDGEYEFGGQTITVKDGVARTPEGAIAGSTTNLFNCVRCAISFGIPKDEAFKMASLTPATLIGETNKGRIEVGADADIIAVDSSTNLKLSMVGGKIYYRS